MGNRFGVYSPQPGEVKPAPGTNPFLVFLCAGNVLQWRPVRRLFGPLALVIPPAAALSAAWIHSDHRYYNPTSPFDGSWKTAQAVTIFAGIFAGWCA